MKKSETEDSTDDVFYSLSSAVSVTASDVTRTPSPTPTSSQIVTPENKVNKGLSRLKSFRPKKLIPKRFKSSVGASDDTPEVQKSPLLKSDSESPADKGKKESKIPRRSKASQIVRRFTFKKGQKVAPKANEGDEDTSTTSSSTTPMSKKREIPTGTTLSISDQSLCVVEERSVEESSADQSERKSSSASTTSSTKQELKITISGKKIEKLKRLYEKGDNNDDNASKETTNRSFDELKYDVSATITRDTNTASPFQSSSLSDKTSLNAVMKTRNNSSKKKSTTTIAPVILPSPPPTPLMSIHIPLKPDTPKPISTIPMKSDQIPSITTTTATTRSVSSENKNIVTDSDERSLDQQLVKTVGVKKESLKAKLINKLNINRSVHDITPAIPAPTVPYKISDTEIINIIGTDANPPHKQLTPDEYKKFIKQDRDQSFSEQISEKIFTLDDLTDNSMKRSDESDSQQHIKSKGSKKRSKRSITQDLSSPDSGLSTSVHVQEPQKSYQKQLSTGSGTNEPEITFSVHEEDEVTFNKSGEISFRIGTPVRPLHTTQITHITESISIDSSDQQKSLEEISSISSESQSPPLSENSRRKIKYLPQPTLFSSAEEQALLEGNFGPPSSFIGSEYSIDYSLNPLSMVDTNTEGTSPVAAATNLTMSSSEKREHLYKILVIGELGTGKTSFIKRYVHQFFSQNYRATIGVDFALKVLNWDPNTIIRLQLWDIAGQERFGNMTRVYYKEAVGAFIVFDVTRTSSFDAVIKWKQDLDSKVQLPDGSSIPCILLANKCDQQKQGIVTTPAKLDEYCKENGFSGWFETSAKENINIDDAAKALVNKILANDKVMNSNEAEMDGFAIDGRDNGTSKKNCAC